MNGDYDISDLLELAVSEHALGLTLDEGKPPILHIHDENHVIEGPDISPENADALLRSLIDADRMRELREQGSVIFNYSFRDSADFLGQARLEQGEIRVVLFRLG